jgi:hypothetical protein
MTAAWMRVATPSLRIALSMWKFTVRSLTRISTAMSVDDFGIR